MATINGTNFNDNNSFQFAGIFDPFHFFPLLNGTNGNDSIFGLDGNDILIGFDGNDLLDGGQGFDLLDGANGNDTLMGGSEDDSLYGADGMDSLDGGTGNDILNGGFANDTLYGGSGNDTLDGGTGADVMDGGDQDDVYYVDNAGDKVSEQWNDIFGGKDKVYASASHTLGFGIEDLTLTGTANINGTGNENFNIIYGNSGNNVLDGKANGDEMHGQAGNDTYIVDSVYDDVIEVAGEGIDTVKSSITYVLGDTLENLTLTGTGVFDGLGNAWGNKIIGNTAHNQLFGFGGDDNLDGCQGADFLAGGAGNDNYVVDNAGDVVFEYANDGIDKVSSSVSFGLGDNVENLTLTGTISTIGKGNNLDNTLTGNDASNDLYGYGGNDNLNGGIGADYMAGGIGNDNYTVDNSLDIVVELAGEGTDKVSSSVSYTLSANVENLTLTGTAAIDGNGNSLNNTIIGNNASNVIYGGAGQDQLKGAGSADTFKFTALSDSVVGNGRDKITDFSHAEGDKIDLSGIDANSLVIGDQAFTFIGNQAFTGAGQVRFDQGVLQVNVDGDFSAELEIGLTGVTTVAATDFVF